MQEALADFRIENDSVVLLSFADGSSYRVNPKDLDRYVSQQDLTAIQRALQLRKQFISRILPPTLMVFLAATIIGVGGHDVQRIQALMHPSTGQATGAKTIHPVPASTKNKNQHSLPATAPTAKTSNESGDSSEAASRQRIAAETASKQSGDRLEAPEGISVSQTTEPLTHAAKSALAPVTTVVQPVDDAVNGLLGATPLP